MKLKAFKLAALIAVLGFCACSDDDDDNPTMVNTQDSTFVSMAGMSNTAEVDAGRLAVSMSTDSSIKAFGQMMIDDHTAAQAELKTLASQYGLMAPDSLDAAHVALKAQLMTLSGRAFDSAYIHSQVTDHQTAITLFQNENSNGNNTNLRNFANEKLPTLQMHLMHADSLSANY